MEISSVRQVDDLFSCLGIDRNVFDNICREGYRTYYIPKKKGGVRRIDSPGPELQKVQKKFAQVLSELYAAIMPPNVFGHTRPVITGGIHSIKANAMLHTGKPWILNIDIKNFFGSVTGDSINRLFREAPFNFGEDICAIANCLLSYKEVLPAGAPSSPVISNLIFRKCDIELMEAAAWHGAVYSRYADDLTFSFEYKPRTEFIRSIYLILERFGFKINHRKLVIRSHSQRQEVTGLVVNSKVNIKREYYKALRAIIYNLLHKDFDTELQKYITGNLNSFYRLFRQINHVHLDACETGIANAPGLSGYPTLLKTLSDAEYFTAFSVLGKLRFITSIVGWEDQKVRGLWDLYIAIVQKRNWFIQLNNISCRPGKSFYSKNIEEINRMLRKHSSNTRPETYYDCST